MTTRIFLRACVSLLLVSGGPDPSSVVEGHMGHGEVKAAPLLVISFDGFRYDYISRANATLTSFQRLQREGVYARRGVMNMFPTSTITNHWSLVTGLYPESTGMVNNDLKDPAIQKKFVPKWRQPEYHNDPAWYDSGGEPIWVTNEINSKNGRSGTVMWYGAENAVKSYRPSLHMDFDKEVSSNKRIDTVLEWLTLPHHPINLGLVYFNEPDDTAHHDGAESPSVTEEVTKVNNVIAYLFAQLEERDMLDDVNIIITSDHGMVDVSPDKVINLDTIVEPQLYEALSLSPVAFIYPKEGQYDQVLTSLTKAASKEDSHFKVYAKDAIPDKYHLRHNVRAPPIMAVVDLHWSFVANWKPYDKFTLGGQHGYDNDNPEMHPFFMAMGPSFKAGEAVDTFNIVDIYPLMCKLLAIPPAPNNGSLSVVDQLLSHEENETTMWTFATYILVLIVIALVGGVFSIAAWRQHRYLKRKVSQLRLSPMQGGIRYSVPAKGEAKARLLSSDDDDFEDASDEEDDNILKIVSAR